ncbi:TonB C-terminal domain-containing protein [Myxococcus sp. K15C18031901]|uniref:TonB family protein n=1 Tax=Myxococcus dinghuensis TaxID=2906761 RepID=UPI0020A719D0|nr:TonB family protein [Myxococcus dinghuensis]MCP3097462.1 TonB C-terminal domain-containing protein [Myxococcus dinghuensis]
MLRLRSLSSVPAVCLLLLAPLALAASGTPQLQTYFQPELTDATYQQQAYGKVAVKWKQPGKKGLPAVGRKAVVQAVIGRDGKLISAVVSTESGSKAWDDAALAAVKKAAPFPPLPKSFSPPTMDAHFHFAWVAGS